MKNIIIITINSQSISIPNNIITYKPVAKPPEMQIKYIAILSQLYPKIDKNIPPTNNAIPLKTLNPSISNQYLL